MASISRLAKHRGRDTILRRQFETTQILKEALTTTETAELVENIPSQAAF